MEPINPPLTGRAPNHCGSICQDAASHRSGSPTPVGLERPSRGEPEGTTEHGWDVKISPV